MPTLTRIIIGLLVAIILIGASTYIYRWGTMLWTRGVPTVSTFVRHYELLKQIQIAPGSKVIDLGCGTGHALRWFAQHYDDLQLTGVDINRLALRRGQWQNKRRGYTITLTYQDIFATDLRNYDYIYVYLLPKVMPDIETYLQQHAHSGTTIICNAFPLPNGTPTQTITNAKGQPTVFVYTV